MGGIRARGTLLVGAALVGMGAGAAHALTIVPVYDSSVTTLSNASAVEATFNAVAADFDKSLGTPVTVHVDVSWNKVDGQALPSYAVGASVTNLYGYYSYGQMVYVLDYAAAANPSDAALRSAAANLPTTTPWGATRYVIPSAEAKALQIIPANQPGPDGYIGFAGASSGYTFETAAQLSSGAYTIAGGTYDFAAVAAHELEEVLGRISGIGSSGQPSYRTLFDLYRYSAKGVLNDSSTAPAYFSIDGGASSEAQFNTSGKGDRGDWRTTGYGCTGAQTSAVSCDIQDAYIAPGERLDLSAADLTALDALGYDGSNIGTSGKAYPGSIAFGLVNTAPEPSGWVLALCGVALAGAGLRRRRAGETSL